jgi:putative ABC transport system permease protein
MFKLISHSIQMRFAQGVSIVFIVAVGVAALFAFLLISRGVGDGVAIAEERGGAQILVLPAKADIYRDDDALLFSGAPVNFYMNSDLFAGVQALDGVKRATCQFFAQTLDASCCSALGETRLVGIDAATDWLVPGLLDKTTVWDGRLSDRQVILGSNVEGFASGSGRVRGEDVAVIAVMAPTGTGLDDSIVVSIDYARHLATDALGSERFQEQNGAPSELISAILIDAVPGGEERLRTQLEALRDVRVVKRSEAIERSQEQLRVVFGLLAGMAAAMALASLLQLSARYYAVSWERKSELALYRALGATRGDLLRIICGEAFILTGAGALVGLAGGAGLFALTLVRLESTDSFPFLMPSASAFAISAVAVVLVFAFLTFLAIALPLRRVARIEPSLALQQVDIA